MIHFIFWELVFTIVKIWLIQEGNSNLNCVRTAVVPMSGWGGGGGPSSNFVHQMCHQGGGSARDFGTPYLQNYLSKPLQILICCSTHLGLPVCRSRTPYTVCVMAIEVKCLNCHHTYSYRVWGFGIQVVLGVSYNILNFQVDRINTFGDMAIQNLDDSKKKMFDPPPPPLLAPGGQSQKLGHPPPLWTEGQKL